MLVDEIKKIVKGDVLVDEKTLGEYSEDASIFKIKPEVVVFPKNTEDIKNLVKFVASKKKKDKHISISPRSAGTDMTGGSLTESIVLGFTRYLNHVKEIKREGSGGYALTEPGVFYRDFELETLKKGLIYPPYPASRELCAMGGIVANNSAGEKSLSLGEAKDYILGLKVVLGDGNEYTFGPLKEAELKKKIKLKTFEGKIHKQLFALIKKNEKIIQTSEPKVSKNSSGYFLWNVWKGGVFDINQLLVGSQGTLGIITEAKLRLTKVEPHSRMVVVFLKDLKPLGDIVNTILEFKPETLECYDNKTLMLAFKFLPSLIKSLLAKRQNLFKLFFQFLPDFWVLLTSGFSKLVLLAEFSGENENQVINSSKLLLSKIKSQGFEARRTKSKDEGEKYWTIRRESFNLLRKKVKNRHTAPFIDDVIVNPKDMPEFLPRLNALVEKYKELNYTIAGHAGDGNFHIIPLADFKNPELKKVIQKLSGEVYDLVREFGGSITAEHNDGLVRTPYLSKMYSPKMIKLFEEVKKIFDPQSIFNPGKKVNGNLKYGLDHLKKE
ncbi:MAG: putative oxidoreductase [Parcubacteria group bacterium Gr01-1014_20]|nr:MAG: putative oxidoreductase [Parcubacteria group bacterium Gr01-1014_20]